VMERAGLRPSEFARRGGDAPIVLVGRKLGKPWFCPDCCQLDEVTKKGAYPLP